MNKEEKEFFIDLLINSANSAFIALNRAIKYKNALLANVSLDAINKTINFINKVEQEENKPKE